MLLIYFLKVLMELIFNTKAMEEALSGMEFDIKRTPLGKCLMGFHIQRCPSSRRQKQKLPRNYQLNSKRFLINCQSLEARWRTSMSEISREGFISKSIICVLVDPQARPWCNCVCVFPSNESLTGVVVVLGILEKHLILWPWIFSRP